MASKNYTEEEKNALRETKEAIDVLVKAHGQEKTLWAVRRIMENIRSLARLSKQEQKLENELKDVRAKMNFDK